MIDKILSNLIESKLASYKGFLDFGIYLEQLFYIVNKAL